MRLLSRLEAEQKSSAIRYLLFRQSPKSAELRLLCEISLLTPVADRHVGLSLKQLPRSFAVFLVVGLFLVSVESGDMHSHGLQVRITTIKSVYLVFGYPITHLSDSLRRADEKEGGDDELHNYGIPSFCGSRWKASRSLHHKIPRTCPSRLFENSLRQSFEIVARGRVRIGSKFSRLSNFFHFRVRRDRGHSRTVRFARWQL